MLKKILVVLSVLLATSSLASDFSPPARSNFPNSPTLGALSFHSSTSNALANGISSVIVTSNGNGGVDGTYDAIVTGCALPPNIRFTVFNGSVVTSSVTIRSSGVCATTPTISFSSSSGLTGALATAALSSNVPSGAYFAVPGAGNIAYSIYTNNAGVAQLVSTIPATTTFVQEQVTVTGINTLATLAVTPSSFLFLLVNGVAYTATGSSPAFTRSGAAITWLSSNAGFSIKLTDHVVAVYSY